jgi:hypothetical protein
MAALAPKKLPTSSMVALLGRLWATWCSASLSQGLINPNLDLGDKDFESVAIFDK